MAAGFLVSCTTSFTSTVASTFFSTIDGAATFSATGVATGADVVAIPCTRSNRSRRASSPESLESPIGNKIRPQISSRINRGAVAPRICVRPSAAISAARERVAAPRFFACVTIRSSWSSGISRRIELACVAASASTIIRSRSRSSRSLVKRRGSWPDSMTRSTVLNSVAPSLAASASTASSNSAPSVNPRS